MVTHPCPTSPLGSAWPSCAAQSKKREIRAWFSPFRLCPDTDLCCASLCSLPTAHTVPCSIGRVLKKMTLAPSPFPAFPNQIWHRDSQKGKSSLLLPSVILAPGLDQLPQLLHAIETYSAAQHDCQHSLSQILPLKELLCLSIKHLIFFTFHIFSICLFSDSRDSILGSTLVFYTCTHCKLDTQPLFLGNGLWDGKYS